MTPMCVKSVTFHFSTFDSFKALTPKVAKGIGFENGMVTASIAKGFEI